MKKRLLIKNIGQLVSYNSAAEDMQVLTETEMMIEGAQVVAIGKDLYTPGVEVIDARQGLITPGFVDPHTHPVFYNTREQEYEMRIKGKSYREIAAAGGGIRSTVRDLRQAPPAELRRRVNARLDEFLAFGITTIEAKSGYGLDRENELKSLRLLQDLGRKHVLDIATTFLGAHEYPDEYQSDHQGYIDLIIREMLPRVVQEKLAQFCDVFCEAGVFSVDETRQVAMAAKELGLELRLHADEFEPIGGVQLAVELGARSVDHLSAITPDGIAALQSSSVIPILLPATTFFLGSDNYAPGRQLWDQGLPVALATDFNPGSSMTQSMPLVITLACLKQGLTPLEALQAATYHAARSLNMDQQLGSLTAGKQADFILWRLPTYQGIPYFLGARTIRAVWKKGQLVWQYTA